jgi:hypothetical protein
VLEGAPNKKQYAVQHQISENECVLTFGPHFGSQNREKWGNTNVKKRVRF